LYLVSAIDSALANDVYTFMFAWVIGGLGVGISTVAAPLFISEIAPAKDRGKLAGMFQFNIVFGILVAFFSNYLIGTLIADSTAWRWMLGVEAVPALFLCGNVFYTSRKSTLVNHPCQ
jgi:SP family arabinose:H+ symporter-like MFS transporter